MARRDARPRSHIVALGCGGCSLSGQFDSLFGEKSDRTGTITPPPGTKEVVQLPPDADLAYARAAASAVLSRGEKDTSMPWENPSTGARGTVTPIASAYTQDGRTCRDFLASFVTRQFAVLAAGRSLQAEARRLGSSHVQALEILGSQSSPSSSFRSSDGAESALHLRAQTPH